MRRLMVLFVAAVVVGVLVPTTAAGATSSSVSITSCGQVITSDAVLRTDLVCRGDGLTIAASNLTVRMAGHSIASSDGTGVGIRIGVPEVCTSESCTPGVCVTHVTVQGGTISGFLDGVSGFLSCGSPGSAGAGGAISGMTLTGNTWGASLRCEFPLAVDRTTIVGPNGIRGTFFCGGAVTLTRSTIEVTSPAGVSVADSDRGLIDSSRLTGGSIVSGPTDDELTIAHSRLADDAVSCSDGGLTITDTSLIDSSISAVECGMGFSGDRLVGPGSGIGLATGVTNYGISISDSSFYGWDTAVQLGLSDENSIVGNTFGHNGTAISCYGCVGSVIGNRFEHNQAGFVGCTDGVYCPGSGGTITGNRFVENTGPGLVLTQGTWKVGDNVALRNGGLGIDARFVPLATPVYGTGSLALTDLGGDVARRNQPPQCIGVACTR